MVRDIGKFIKEMRKTVGLTQKELAGNIGVSDKTISKWEWNTRHVYAPATV